MSYFLRDHSGECVFRNDSGDSISLSNSKMKATPDKKYAKLIGQILGYCKLVEK